ncbi:MAG: hypothetical protein WA020_10865 [Candidatus Acidiferrales bacterium]|jgi:hypothetical protein
MDYKPILTFDTSAINHLADDPDSDALIARLTSGFHVRLTFMSISEVIATKNTHRNLNRRGRLVSLCRRLLFAGDAIDPQDVLLEKLITAFEGGSSFDWRSVDVGFPEAERISCEENLSDEVSEEARAENRAINNKFKGFYAGMKPHYDKLFADGGAVRPATFPESITRLKAGKTFVAMARSLYEGGTKNRATDAIVQRFLQECPPFHALMVALCAKRYDYYLRPPSSLSLEAGAADTFMAACLAYCDLFVTADCGQLRCFREVVSFMELAVILKSYQEFRDGLVGARANANSGFQSAALRRRA